MLRKQFTRNSLASAAQVAISSIVLFAIYWYLAREIGVANIGIWSVVLATTSSSSIANLGIATSTVKFVAKYLALDNEEHAVGVVQTSIISVGVIIGLFLLIATPLFYYLLQFFIPGDSLAIARAILPFAIASFWINSVSVTLQAALDGYQRIDLRSIILIVSSLAFVGLVFAFVPQHGLLGLALAQVLQALIVLGLSYYIFRRVLSAEIRFTIRWSKNIFREIINYSLQFQTITISRMLVEPITKALLSRYGGLAATGYFEMALKLVTQIRSVIIVGYQAFVPAIASLLETRKDRIPAVYRKAMSFILIIFVVVLPLIIVSARPVSRIWLGTISPQFTMFLILTSVAWFVNLLSAPAYFVNLGTGELGENIIGHVVTAVLNLALCLTFGQFAGGSGIVIGYTVAIATGSLVTAILYQRRSQANFLSFFDSNLLWLTVASLAGVTLAIAANSWLESRPLSVPVLLVPIVVYSLLVALPLWNHPFRRELVLTVRQSLSQSNNATEDL